MVIDKKLDLDKELEYFPDGSVSFAQNVVVSDDGLTIQNEPAIVNFLAEREFDLVGFVACNEEFVLFSSKNDIVIVGKDTSWRNCDTNWKWQGGIVFGTFSYNINNELIIAISERNPKSDCPLKVINLNRDYVKGYDKDDIYTLTPNIPKSNVVDISYIHGNKIKKGKYNFFIKYFIGDNFETGWFPIGIPVFAYDNTKASVSKTIDYERIQAVDEIDSNGVPAKAYNYGVHYTDYYNNDDEYTNDNIVLTIEMNDKLSYTHYQIGYIINTQTNTEGRKTFKYKINDTSVLINENSEPESVDNLTIGTFNIKNVNTLCNYKDRLYLANYKEENVNKGILNKVDTSDIKIYYNANEKNTFDLPKINEGRLVTRDYTALKNQWKSRPGRGAVYNFYIHYVYPNGNYTDGIPIRNILQAEEIFEYGRLWTISEDVWINYEALTILTNSETTTNEIYNNIIEKENQYENDANHVYITKTGLKDFLSNNLDKKWFDVKNSFNDSGYDSEGSRVTSDEVETPLWVSLENYVNSNGDVLFITPTDKEFNVNKLYFTGIKMYPEFVGYFISYEEPEYIHIGEGFLVDSSIFDIRSETAFGSSKGLKFYYPEFSIIGGKINIDYLIISNEHTNIEFDLDPRVGKYSESGRPSQDSYKNNKNSTGILLPTSANFTEQNFFTKAPVSDINIVSPNDYNNIGREGYIKLELKNDLIISNSDTKLYTVTAFSNNRNIYLNENKKLVSLGYIKYMPSEESSDCTYGYEDVPYNYDFYKCFSSIIFFNTDGVITNSANSNPVNATTGADFYKAVDSDENANQIPHIGIIKYWHDTHYPLFLKEINNGPEVIFHSYYTKVAGEDSSYKLIDKQTQTKNSVISPSYVNDLYKLDAAAYSYTGKLIVNYDDSLYSSNIEQYNKTIRRSDVLQSESVKTAWRYFRPENYKVITEDKGDIKNVVGIGNYLFAHCEHSLFLFDITDSLQALDKNVQLLQPDSFEVNYKEVFTADKGYGGLQDYVSWICDEFGYIFFDESAQKIYRFDGGQLKDMSDGINNLIKGISAQSIFFGNDRPRNRILANLRGTDDNVIISYNLLSNGWISTHSYVSNYNFIGLKDKVFLLNVEGSNLTINHYLETEFNKYSLPVGNIDNDGSFKSFVDVVFTNRSYNKIKVLDFITYIINKEPADNFELLQLEIFTNCCYSGVIDISQERKKVSEYKKPYYDFERWNFNYFRNVIDKIENGDIVDRISGRIHSYPQKVQRGYDNALMSGKYVVIRFSFKLMSKQVNVKDVQAYFKP